MLENHTISYCIERHRLAMLAIYFAQKSLNRSSKNADGINI